MTDRVGIRTLGIGYGLVVKKNFVKSSDSGTKWDLV